MSPLPPKCHSKSGAHHKKLFNNHNSLNLLNLSLKEFRIQKYCAVYRKLQISLFWPLILLINMLFLMTF